MSDTTALGSSEPPPAAILQRFESLGDNCEFGMMQRHYGVERFSLLRWGSFVGGFAGLLTAVRFHFVNVGANVDHHINGNEYISHDMTYGIVFHTDKMVGTIDPDKLVANERVRIAYLARNLVDELREGSGIFVYKREKGIDEAQVRELHAALRAIGPVRLLWVVPAMDPAQVGMVERIGPDLIRAYIDRFSPDEAVLSYCSHEVWLQICQAAIALVDS